MRNFVNLALYAFLDAWNNDELPDGAWMEMLKEGVRAWNQQHNECRDPHDTVIEYLEWRADNHDE